MKKGTVYQAVLFSLWAPAGWKGDRLRGDAKGFELKTGIDVNVKSFLQGRVPVQRGGVAKVLERVE